MKTKNTLMDLLRETIAQKVFVYEEIYKSAYKLMLLEMATEEDDENV